MIEDFPKVSPNLVIERENGLSLLLDSEVPAWALVNPMGEKIATLLTGKNSIKEITQIIGESYLVDYNQAFQDVTKFIDYLKKAGLAWFGKRELLPPIILRPKSEILYLEITDQCNLACRHCFAASSQSQRSALSLEEIRKVIAQFASLEGEKLCVSGGEPLRRDDWLEILKFGVSQGLKVELITNGTLISPSIAKSLSSLEVKVQVSLDGAQEETNDLIRGRGSYQAALAGLKAMLNSGMGKRVVISMTPVFSNIKEIEEMIGLALKLGVGEVHISHLMKQGRAKNHWSQWGVSSGKRKEVFLYLHRKVKELKGKFKISGSYCEQLFSLVFKVSRPPVLGCASGNTLRINPEGEVFSCPYFGGFPDYSLGNIRKSSLEEITEGQRLRQLLEIAGKRVNEIEKCHSCQWRYFCRGGCLADSLAHKGSFWEPDSFCEVKKELFRRFIFTTSSEEVKEWQVISKSAPLKSRGLIKQT